MAAETRGSDFRRLFDYRERRGLWLSSRYAVPYPLFNTITANNKSGVDANAGTPTTVAVTPPEPQPIVVNTTADEDNAMPSTGCSLREAIIAANTNAAYGDCTSGTAGADTIWFALGSGTPTINLTDGLPFITEPLAIDGNNPAQRVRLDGAATSGWSGLSLFSGSDGSSIKSLIITRFAHGIGIFSNNNTVRDCYLGTDATGTPGLGNQVGLSLNQNADGNVIGGVTAADRNVISGNLAYGIWLLGDNFYGVPENTLIQGNYIGTTPDGATALGNSIGIYLQANGAGIPNNTIGGTTTGAGNLISGNFNGVWVQGEGSDNNKIWGNYIGTKADGQTNLGNSNTGVFIFDGAKNNQIGGSPDGAGNRIAFNAGGVSVSGATSTGNAILRNAMFGNQFFGIDLEGLPNDPQDIDTGANNLQNTPTLTAVTNGGLVTGTFNSTPNRSFRLEYFANTNCHPSGNGEGENYLGAQTVTTNDNGDTALSFNFTFDPGRPVITATATDLTTNDTSEFSVCVRFCPTITVGPIPALLPNPATLGTAYPPVTFNGSGGTGPYTFSYSGTLPTGLDLIGATLAGTPSTAGTFNFTVQATDANGCVGTQAYSITVSCPTYTITPPALPNGTVNVFYDQQLTASGGGGGPYQFGFINGLPPNLFVTVDGRLLGAPTTAGTYSFSVPVFENINCIGSQPYTLTINPPPCPTITLNPTTPLVFGLANMVYPNTTIGVSGAGTYSFTHSGLPPGMTFTGTAATTRTLGGTPTTPGAYNLTVTATNNASGCSGSRTFLVVVHAATPTLLVTTAEDENGTNPAACSLREAIIAANSNAPFGGCGAGQVGHDTLGFAAPYSIALTSALPGPGEPVFVDGAVAGARVELNGAGVAASQVLLVESGYHYIKSLVINRLAGGNAINLNGANAVRNVIEDCRLGTNTAGTAALPNGGGVGVFNAGLFNRLGSVALPNVISGNSSAGVNIVDAPGTSVTGNLIGLQADGTAPLGNGGDGVNVRNTVAPGSTIFVTSIVSNKIAYNAIGISITDTALGQRTGLGGNSIFNNAALGIDLGGDGVTPNDAGDGDSGPNRLQNYPVLTGITPTATGGTVTATLDTAAANASFNVSVQFFASSACDPSGYGEGESFLGQVTGITAAQAASGFSFNYTTAQVFGKPFITAIAVDNSGNASEFSACRAVPNDPPTLSGATLSIRQGDAVALRQIGTAGDAQQAPNTLTFQISNGGVLNGIHVTFTQIQATGEVLANVFAECAATNATFTVSVTDAQNVTANATLTVNVLPNLPPTLSYSNPGPVLIGTSGSVMPATGPNDATTLSVLSVTPNTFTGTLAVNSVGQVLFTNAGPVGTYQVTMRATDNCGALTDTGFILNVVNTAGGPGVTPPLPPGSPQITFSNVILPGNTTVTTIPPNTAGALPSGFSLPGFELAFEIATTAVFNGPIVLTFEVPSVADPAVFDKLRVFHNESGVLVDRTILPPNNPAPNFSSKKISALVNSLSPFVVAGLVTTPTITVAATPTSTAVGQPATFTATVTSGSLPVVQGTVIFKEGATVLAGPTPLSASGQASFNTAALTVGAHTITAEYSGATLFNPASGNTLLSVGCTSITLASVPAATAGTAYNQTISATPAGGNYSFALSGGALPPGLNLSNGVLSGTPTQAGNFSFTLTATGFGTCAQARTYSFPVNCPTVTLSPATLPNGVSGSVYGPQTFSAAPLGTVWSFAVTQGQLPPGLTLNSTTGVFGGTPTAAGNYSFSITASGFGTCASVRTYSLLITGTCAPITVTPATLPGGTLGTGYHQTLSGSGSAGPYSYSLSTGALPPGLTLNASTGVLNGTPAAGGTFTFTVKATGAGGCTGQRLYVLTIACGPLTWSPETLPNGLKGQVYSQPLSVSPSGNPTFSLLTGQLPPGFTLSATGTLSGVSNNPGTFNFTVKAVAGSCQSTKGYALTINNLLAVNGDFDGDGMSDPYSWQADQGVWLIARSGDGVLQKIIFGTSGDYSAAGDYDGDGQWDVAVFRPANGTWYVRLSGNGQTLAKAWGAIGDTPVPGDYDADGKTDFAVWRGAEGRWYVLRSSDGMSQIEDWGAASSPYQDVPVPGDYDGDGKTDLAVFRRSNGVWLIKGSSDGATRVQAWGLGTDKPVAADYDGDKRTDIAVWRGQEGAWYILGSAANAVITKVWGSQLSPYFDTPVPHDYDGDGQADVAVCRQGKIWYIVKSSDGATATKQLP